MRIEGKASTMKLIHITNDVVILRQLAVPKTRHAWILAGSSLCVGQAHMSMPILPSDVVEVRCRE